MAVDVKPDPQALGENPLIEGLERLPVPATTLTIFGVTGDLAHRKLLPALYNLAHEGALPERFNLSASPGARCPTRSSATLAKTRSRSSRAARPTRRCSTACSGGCTTSASRSTTTRATRGCARADRPARRGRRRQAQPRLLPLDRAGVLPGHRRARSRTADLNYDADVDVRCIIEKPFGVDLESALELQRVVEHVFREQQVYRIDHYLGKETVQNVMAFRFANFMFEPVWNRNYIEHIQITAAEDIGIGSRAGLLRPGGRAARPRAEPHAAAADARLHGAAGLLRGRQGPRREGQGPAGDHAADARGGAARHRARAVRRRASRAARRSAATSRRTASRTTRAPRPTRRCAWRSTTGAGRACRSSCAPAST